VQWENKEVFQMLTPTEYDGLGKHLLLIDHILERFCKEEGFSYSRKMIGRYPRRRIEKTNGSHPNLFFDLQMDRDANNKQFEVFFEGIPYSLSMGAWMDIG
jgi:hypothetical protein